MTISILWEPWKPKPRCIGVGHSGPFIRALEEAFEGRLILDNGDLRALRAMAAVDSEFHQLVVAVEKHGEIRIWTES